MRTAFAACLALWGFLCATPSTAGELEERRAIEEPARRAFLDGRFEDLEETAKGFGESRETTGSGVRKLSVFHVALGSVKALYGAADEAAYGKADAQLQAWITAYPFSKPASALRAAVLVDRAFVHRGHETADLVKPEARSKFQHYVDEARRELARSEPFASDDPEWHSVALLVALYQGWPRVEVGRMELRALELDPFYEPIHSSMLHSKLPAWGGSWAEIDDAIDQIVARTSSESGRSFYALGYAYVARHRLRGRLFEKSMATWPRMKQGFEDLIARRPTEWNLNIFAVNACYAQDWDTLQSLLVRLDGRFVDHLWVAKDARDSCVGTVEQRRIEAEDAAYYSKPIPVAAEMAERFRLEDEAAAALLAGRFDEIEVTRARYLASKERTASGAWKLASYTEGLTLFRKLLPGNGAVSDEIKARIREWKAAHPQSVAATIATARLHLVEAKTMNWKDPKIEAGEGVSTVASLLDSARRELESARTSGERDPVWWATRMLIAVWDIVPDETFEGLARQALAAAPDYDELRVHILARPSARSSAFLQEYDRAIKLTLASLQPEERDEAYADAFLRFGERWGGDGIVDQLKIDWPRMRRGLDAIVARWPTDWNLTAYARFACMAKDKPTAAALMSRVGDRLVWLRWTNWRGHDQCRSWAQAAQ